MLTILITNAMHIDSHGVQERRYKINVLKPIGVLDKVVLKYVFLLENYSTDTV